MNLWVILSQCALSQFTQKKQKDCQYGFITFGNTHLHLEKKAYVLLFIDGVAIFYKVMKYKGHRRNYNIKQDGLHEIRKDYKVRNYYTLLIIFEIISSY